MRRSVLEPVVLSDQELETLERWARRRKAPRRWRLGAGSSSSVPRAATTPKWPNASGSTGAASRSGVGASRPTASTASTTSLDRARHAASANDAVEAVIVKTLEETPSDATHWSTRSMAKATGMSQSAVSRILARLRAQAPSGRHLQADRPIRCSSRRCATSSGSTSNPPEASPRALRGREVPDPGA